MDPLAWPILIVVIALSFGGGYVTCLALLYRHWCGRHGGEPDD